MGGWSVPILVFLAFAWAVNSFFKLDWSIALLAGGASLVVTATLFGCLWTRDLTEGSTLDSVVRWMIVDQEDSPDP